MSIDLKRALFGVSDQSKEAQKPPKSFHADGCNLPSIKDGVLRPTEDKAIIVPYSKVKPGFSDIAVVCDGVGGNGGGAIAAEVGVQKIKERLENGHRGVANASDLAGLMKSAIESAHVEILGQQEMGNGRQKMATTAVVGGWVVEGGMVKAVVAWAGNSRVYLHWRGPDGKWREQIATCDDGKKVDYLKNQMHMSPSQAMAFIVRAETEPESAFAGSTEEATAYFLVAKSLYKNVTTNTLGSKNGINVHTDILALPNGATDYWLSAESDGSACLMAEERIAEFGKGGAKQIARSAREKSKKQEMAKTKQEIEASGGTYLDDITVVTTGFY